MGGGGKGEGMERGIGGGWSKNRSGKEIRIMEERRRSEEVEE